MYVRRYIYVYGIIVSVTYKPAYQYYCPYILDAERKTIILIEKT